MSEWKKVKLGECISTKKGFAFKSNLYTTEGIPVVRVSDFTFDSITNEDLVYYPTCELEKYLDYVLNEKDILIQTVGSWQNNPKSVVGKVVHVPYYHKGSLLNQNIVKIIPLKEYERDFLFYRLRCIDFSGYVLGEARGAANQASITLETIKRFPFYCPKLASQQRIASILSRYDSLIENYQKQIKLLEEAAQRLYKEWFVDLRFPGYENTPVVNGVPEGWYISSITDTTLFSFVKSRVSKFDGEKIYYATADVDNTYICGNGITVNYDNKPSRAQIIPPPYSIWFARMSKSYKILGFSEKNEDRRKKTIISSGFAGFQSKVDTYGFMYCMISSQWFNNEKDRFATGSTQVSLTNEGLSRIACLFPKEDIAIKFSRVTNNIIERMVLLKETCFILTEARDRLLPKLMSGEIEV